jgi:hypothetical protein
MKLIEACGICNPTNLKFKFGLSTSFNRKRLKSSGSLLTSSGNTIATSEKFLDEITTEVYGVYPFQNGTL